MAAIEIVPEASDAFIASWLHKRLSDALADGDAPVAVTFPGGTTPFPILEQLIARDLDWRRITVWPNDDRVVPEGHPASNTGRLRALLSPQGCEVVTLSEMEQVPRFALAWLGMGADGHVASLFPNTDPRVEDDQQVRRLTPDPLPPDAPFERITLTLPALLDSDALLLVIRGAGKRAVFDEAALGRNDLPIARLLGAARQPVTCFT